MTISPSDLFTKALWSALLAITWLAVRDLARAVKRWLDERRCPHCHAIHCEPHPLCHACSELGWDEED